MLSSLLASLQELSEAAPGLLILKCVCAALPTTGDCSGSSGFPHL